MIVICINSLLCCAVPSLNCKPSNVQQFVQERDTDKTYEIKKKIIVNGIAYISLVLHTRAPTHILLGI